MKDFISTTYTFTPAGAGVGTVALEIPNFDIKRLVAIINQTRGVVIYNTADTTNLFTNLNGSTLTLNADTSTHASSDILQVIYNTPLQDDVMEFIHEALRKLDFLSSVRGTDATIRSSIVSGTLPTVSTVSAVSTVANMTTMGGYSTNTMIPNLMNQTAVLSNINNIIVS